MIPSPRTTILAVSATCSLYALARYVLLGPVPGHQVPLFIANKAVSWAGLMLVGLAPLVRDQAARSMLGAVAFLYLVVHAIASAVLLGPVYFPKLFLEDGRISGRGQMSLLLGAVALALLTPLFAATLAGRGPDADSLTGRFRGFGRAVLALTAGHVAFLGWPGWWTPSAWYGGLPPITLLSFVTAVALLVTRWTRTHRAG